MLCTASRASATFRPPVPDGLAREVHALPVEWRQRLADGTVRGDIQSIRGLIDEIRANSPAVASTLTRMVDNFAFDELHEALAGDD